MDPHSPHPTESSSRPEPLPPRAEILVEAGLNPGLTVSVTDRFVVGRDAACDLAVFDTSVSRHHLRIERDEHGFLLHDLGSGNGTHVNGVRVETGRLYHRDVIVCGAVRMRFLAPGCPDPAKTSILLIGGRRTESERLRLPCCTTRVELDALAPIAASDGAGAQHTLAVRTLNVLAAIADRTEPQGVFETLMGVLDALVPCDRIVLCRYEETSRSIVPMLHRRAPSDPPGGTLQLDHELVSRCCETGKAMACPAAGGGHRIVVPLLGRRRVVGAMALEVGPAADGPAALPFLCRVGRQAGLVLEESEVAARVLQQQLRLEELHREARAAAEALAQEQAKLRERDEQFLQAQKMEAVGRLAGGVAHDFNNLLTAILGTCELRLADATLGPRLRSAFEQIRKAGTCGASLTRQLLAFSRRQVLQQVQLDLNLLIRGMVPMVQRLVCEHIELATELAPDLGLVLADPGQIEQVVLNLVVNAADAMPRGGTLTIRTGNCEVDDAWFRRLPDGRAGVPGRNGDSGCGGQRVMLSVSDTGVGMDRETRARIFEPFFTTKEPGKGTGLGLSTVYGIVAQSQGDIWVYSEPGQGTAFKIYLPRVEGTVPGGVAGSDGDAVGGGVETVLVAEDDAGVRELVTTVLGQKGYRVLEAASGPEALAAAAAHAGPIHLLITDVVMPRMCGDELWRRLHERRPETRVIFTSGHTDPALVDVAEIARGSAFLGKPFKLEELAAKVREVLDLPR